MAEESAVSFLKAGTHSAHLDKNMYKAETVCIICKSSFTKKNASEDKHACQFCYHAVCGLCSPLTFQHPESKRSEKICLHCYASHVSQHASAEKEDKDQEILKKEIEKYQKDSIELYNNQIKEVMKDKADLKNLHEDQLNRLSGAVQDKEFKLAKKNMNLEQPKRENDIEQDLNGKETTNKLKDLDNENQSLKKEIVILKTELASKKLVTAEPRAGCCSSCTIQ